MVPPPRIVLAGVASVAVALAGCGGGGSTKTTSTSAGLPASTTPQPFPSGRGQTLSSLRAKMPRGPILAPSTTASLESGSNRIAFALRDSANKEIAGAPVAIYVFNHDGGGGRGPFMAKPESIAVPPPYLSKTAASDLQTASSLYVARGVPLNQGKQVVTGVARLDGRLVATTGFELPIPPPRSKDRPPDVGQRAIPIDNPTVADAHGDLSKIDTRIPPAPALLRDKVSSLIGRKPFVLVFATPLLCQSRTCGPVVDVAVDVQAKYGKRVAFVHQEIYRQNQVAKGFTKQVGQWRLPTEPWTFVVDRRGRIASRFEGALSVGELSAAVAKVAR